VHRSPLVVFRVLLIRRGLTHRGSLPTMPDTWRERAVALECAGHSKPFPCTDAPEDACRLCERVGARRWGW